MNSTDTIYAPATGHAGAAIAIVRISGPAAGDVLKKLTGRPTPSPRQASVRRIFDDAGQDVDESLVLWFPGSNTFTGEPLVEIQCHGGRAVLHGILAAVAACEGTRLAEPGEFTRRAVLNGRIGLLEAEGLGDLVAAETEAQRAQARRAMSGAVSQALLVWREKLIRARALVEATIDWADEDVPENVAPEVAVLITDVADAIRSELGRTHGARQIRNGFEVALIGPPNAGKSSLLNALAGREAAIVSSSPGTTRDVVELRFDLNGLPVTFLDTAGLREAEDGIEAEGIRRATSRAGAAALRLHLHSADTSSDGWDHVLWQPGDLKVWSKCDLGAEEADVAVSVQTGEGLTKLLSLIASRLKITLVPDALLTHAWQEQVAGHVLATCEACLENLKCLPAELLAEELRSVIAGMDRLTGKKDVEDFLDVVFSSFCLGK